MSCNLLGDLSKEALYALESNGKGSNMILMFFRQGLKFQKYEKSDLYLLSFPKSSVMHSAHKVLHMERGIVIVLDALEY